MFSSQIGFAQKLDFSPYEGKFDYALLDQTCIYIPLRPIEAGYTHEIWKRCLTPNSKVTLHYGSGPWSLRHSFAWSKSKDMTFGVSFWGSNTGRANTYVDYREFEKKDSVELVRTASDEEIIKKKSVWVTPMHEYYNSFFRLSKRPGQAYTDAMYNTLDFDIYAPSPDRIQFYLRDTTALYIWECQLPADRNPDWKEIKVYTSPKTDFEYAPLKYSKSYSGTKTALNAIQDSLFFEGHFKIIAQGEHKFIINREHALIYYIGNEQIVRIGSVSVPHNYPTIRSKKLFIEDRDNGEIIFFGPVTWEDNNHPKPKIKVMNEAEMKEKFKYVLK
jgi:hypothetical protein